MALRPAGMQEGSGDLLLFAFGCVKREKEKETKIVGVREEGSGDLLLFARS